MHSKDRRRIPSGTSICYILTIRWSPTTPTWRAVSTARARALSVPPLTSLTIGWNLPSLPRHQPGPGAASTVSHRPAIVHVLSAYALAAGAAIIRTPSSRHCKLLSAISIVAGYAIVSTLSSGRRSGPRPWPSSGHRQSTITIAARAHGVTSAGHRFVGQSLVLVIIPCSR